MNEMNRAFVENLIREEIKSGTNKDSLLLKIGVIWDEIKKKKEESCKTKE